MGVTECKECGGEVSSRADECPHCGISNPGGWFSYTGAGGGGCLKVLGCFGIVLLILFLFSLCVGAGAAA